MFGQYSPYKNGESQSVRIKYFKDCIRSLENSKEISHNKIAMPYGIGCGLGGGNWEDYEKILMECKLNIVLYKI